MVLVAGDKTIFYGSKNLINWKMLSTFGQNIGAHGGVWECPELFYINIEGTSEGKWVLMVSINPGGPNGGSATQYFIGDFDGKHFVLDKEFEAALYDKQAFWLDFGKDNYAGVTWSNIPKTDGRRLFMGWMANWQYAQNVPTEKWRSSMTVARELKLIKIENGFNLTSNPVSELTRFKNVKFEQDNIEVENELELITAETVDLSQASISFTISDIERKPFKMTLSNHQGDAIDFGYNTIEKTFFIDRTKSGKVDFSEKFSDKNSKAPRKSTRNNLNAEIIVDKTSIEIFYDGGETVMTEIFFANAPLDTLSITAMNQSFILDQIEVYELEIN
jgi:levanase/fructan beta-fructosidase